MPRTILLTYALDEELWRRFLDAHYRCDPSLKLRWFWGVVCLVIGALGFGGFYDHPLIASLLLATGLYGILSRPLLVAKSLRGARQHPFYGQELNVAVSAEEISVRSGLSGYNQPWNEFNGYRRLAPGFLLYHDRNAFFFIPSAAMDAGEARQVEMILQAAGVANLSPRAPGKKPDKGG